MNRKLVRSLHKPQSEKKVSALLSKKKIENFCPHNRVITGITTGAGWFMNRFFPLLYLCMFPKLNMNEVRRTADILNFVYWLGRPAIYQDC